MEYLFKIPFALQFGFEGGGTDGLSLEIVSSSGNTFENINWILTFYY